MWLLVRWVWTLASKYGWTRVSKIVSWIITHPGTVKSWLNAGWSYAKIFWRIWGYLF